MTGHSIMRFALTEAFTAATEALQVAEATDRDEDHERYESLHNEAFELAKSHGWDWEEDEAFVGWCLKATTPEILSEGLRIALEKCAHKLPNKKAVSVSEQIKSEIREDLGRVRNSAGELMTPQSISCFSDLHDFVDANDYGETHPDVIAAWKRGSEEGCALKNEATEIVDAWLKSAGHHSEVR